MSEEHQRLLSFRAGSRLFGVDESMVATVAAWRQPTPLPHAPPAVMGIVSLQGRMLTVLDLRKLTGAESADNTTPQHVIALRGDEQLALAVDEVEGSIELPNDTNGSQVEVINVSALFSLAIQGRERRQRRF
ncbi:MAG TPA: chemotaxis protein CheW [Pyrinomonadaceae bacterium]|nr:chemotaxis protein CheW [Pyrinomonadaceae bacterium]